MDRDKRLLTVSAVLALFFGTASILGERIFTKGELGITGLGSVALLLVEIGAATLVCFALVAPALTFAKNFDGFTPANYSRGLWALPTVKRRVVVGAGFVVVWSGYWFLLWPGSITQDSFRQIIQALHLVPYTDHHPIAHTLVIEGLLTPLLAITGDITLSLSLITGIQLIALAVLFTLCIDAMRKFSLPSWVMTSTYLLFLLHPVTGWYSVTLWKDIWLSAFVFVLGTASALIVFRARRGEPIGWRLWATFAFSIVAVAFAKKTGLIVVVPLIAVTAMYLRGRTLVRWVGLGVASCVVYLAGHAMLVSALDVKPGSEVEAWSLPVQQIARTVNVHGNELTANEKREIALYFRDAPIGELYQPWISDPIKKRLNEELLKTDRNEFLTLWANLGRQYPVTYVDATLNQTYGYWYPDVTYWMTSASSWSDIVRYNAADKRKESVEKDVARSLFADLYGSDVTSIAPYTPELYPLNSFRRIPVIGWLFSLGAWTWAALALTAVAIVRRNVYSRPISLLMGAVLATCVLSPVYAEARYAYPILLLLPLLAALSFTKTSDGTGALKLKKIPRKKDSDG